MGQIHVLDFSVANLIAAGEVVDRPGSVVKELTENAIDAGATQITIEIKRGGVSFIRVSDNGCGMSREDAPTALRRHATSKIRQAQDLEKIGTLGFRGEALAAISAVTKLRMMTRRAEDANGTLLCSEGGNVKSISDCGCPCGTTVIAEELFYNVPARMKFLKKDATETMNVAANVERVALSHPEISFRLITDGVTRYATVGDGKTENAVYAVLGREFARRMTPVNASCDGVELSGYIGTPENCRSNRNLQIFFINHRTIRSKTMSAALEQAFVSFIPQDKFPTAVLYLDIHPSFVDVNVHPAKLECKFSNEKLIFDTVFYAARNALEKRLERPSFQLSDEERKRNKIRDEVINAFVPLPDRTAPAQPVQTPTDEIPLPQAPPEPREQRELPQPDLPLDIPKIPWEDPFVKPTARDAAPTPSEQSNPKPYADIQEAAATLATPTLTVPQQMPMPESAAPGDVAPSAPKYRIVGELFSSYVIVETGATSYIIDKHAAHERILYEQLRANAARTKPQGQIFLVPLQIPLSVEEMEAVSSHRTELEKIGFRYTVGDKEVSLGEAPSYFNAREAFSAFEELAGQLSSTAADVGVLGENRFDRALYQAACKAAIKAGRNYDNEHLAWICDRLLALPDIKYCPHGRPVCFELTKSGMEHRFLRS